MHEPLSSSTVKKPTVGSVASSLFLQEVEYAGGRMIEGEVNMIEPKHK
jgi:hypothetical protein